MPDRSADRDAVRHLPQTRSLATAAAAIAIVMPEQQGRGATVFDERWPEDAT
jgi:hypothetical protein